MIGASWVLLAGLLLPQREAVPPVTAETRLVPAQAELGEPLELTLELVHPSDVRMRIDELVRLDDPWLLLEERRVRTRPFEGRPGFSVTTARWGVCALDVGEHELVVGGADYDWKDGPRRVEAPPVQVTVRGELADGEDAPRPTVGFREPPPEEAPRTRALLAVLALGAFAGAGLLVWIALRRGRREPIAPSPTPRQRLLALRADGSEGFAELYYALSHALREVIDEQLGEPLAGCTDEEWIARRRARRGDLSPELVERAATLLGACERVKYGAEVPTRWAADEALGAARELATALEPRGGES